MTLPPVSCKCSTFERIDVLNESVFCFLKQTYGGKKQLVVLNDDPNVRIIFDHPEVKIVNLSKRLDLDDKWNHITNLCDYDLVAEWADDDIYAPWAIETLVKYKLTSKKRLINPYPYYKGIEKEPIHAPIFGSKIFEKNLWWDCKRISGLETSFPGGNFRKGVALLNEWEHIKMEDNEAFFWWRPSTHSHYMVNGERRSWGDSEPDRYIERPGRDIKNVVLNPHINEDSKFMWYQ